MTPSVPAARCVRLHLIRGGREGRLSGYAGTRDKVILDKGESPFGGYAGIAADRDPQELLCGQQEKAVYILNKIIHVMGQ